MRPLQFEDQILDPGCGRGGADLTNRVYYFESAANPAVVWVRLDRLKLDAGSPALKLDLTADPDLAGESSAAFKPAQPLKFTLPED